MLNEGRIFELWITYSNKDF